MIPKTLLESITRWIMVEPDHICLTVIRSADEPPAHISYGELGRRTLALGGRLSARYPAGSRILLSYESGEDFLVSFLGCLYGGMVPVPVPPARGKQAETRIAGIVRDAGPACLLTGPGLEPDLAGFAARDHAIASVPYVITDDTAVSDLAAIPERARDAGPDDLVFLQYTSGSTRRPLGTMVSHRNLLANLAMIKDIIGLPDQLTFASWLPLHHDMGLIAGLLLPLHYGGRSVLMPPSLFLRHPFLWVKAISDYRADMTSAPSFAYELCAQRVPAQRTGDLDLSALQAACIGADMIRARSLHAFAAAFAECGFNPRSFYPCYGLAEGTLLVSGAVPGRGVTELSLSRSELEQGRAVQAEAGTGVVPVVGCGHAAAGESIDIIDMRTGLPVPDRTVGEIWVTGPNVAAGYWQAPQDTARTLQARLPGSDSRYLRTGDLGFRHDGEIFVTGRATDMIILRGQNYYPHDLEFAAQNADPALRPDRAAAFAAGDEDEQGIVLVSEVRPSAVQSWETLAATVQQQVAETCGVTVQVAFVRPGAVPRTSSGKVQRRLCRTMYQERSLPILWSTAGVCEPANDLAGDSGDSAQRALAERIHSALRRSVIAALGWQPPEEVLSGPLKRMGLDSSRLMAIKQAVADELGVAVPLPELFSDFRTADLAAELAGRMRALPPPERGIGSGPGQHSPGQHSPGEQGPFELNELQRAYCAGRSGAFELGGVAGHAYAEFESSGVDLAALENAWRCLIDRHEALRIVIDESGCQRVLPPGQSWSMPIADLTAVSDPQDDLALIRDEMSHQFFPLGHWPMFDVRCSLTGAGHVRVHLSIDLLIADAASIMTLAGEWRACYEGSAHGLPVSAGVSETISRQRAVPATPAYGRAAAYWDAQAAAMPPGPKLPLAKRVAAVPQPRFTRRRACLPAADWKQFSANAAAAGVTPAVGLLAAYAEVLSAWSEEPRFTVSMTRAALPPADDGRVRVGPFASFTPTAIDWAEGRSFLDRARRLQERVLRDLDHSEAGGVDIIRRIVRGSDASPGNGARFPVVFTPAMRDLSVFDWLGAEVAGVTQTPQVYLDNQSFLRHGALIVQWDTVEDLFPDGMVADMFAAYDHVLRTLSAAVPWREIPAVDVIPAHQREVIARVNDTCAVLRQERLETLVAGQARRTPGRPAVITSHRELTYAELLRRAAGLGDLLAAQGVRAGDVVALCLESGWEQPVAALAVLRCGAVYLPVAPSLPARRLAGMLACSGASFVLTQSRLAGRLEVPGHCRVLSVDAAEPRPGLPGADEDLSPSPEDLCCLIYTSGSTGTPRAVQLRHSAVVNAVSDTQRVFGVSSADRVMCVTNMQHDMALFDLFGMLTIGGAMVMTPPSGRRDPRVWLDLMDRHQVTIWNSVPTTLRMLVEYAAASARRLSGSLRLTFTGGDWIPLELPNDLARMSEKVTMVSVGGPTEATLWSIWHRIGKLDPALHSIPYGTPIANMRYHVLDGALRERPFWAAGEVCCTGVGVSPGYWRDPSATIDKFMPHPDTSQPMLRTGDIGRRLPDGTIQLLGRRDTQLKIDGNRIDLREVETQIGQLPGISACVVTAATSADGRKHLVAHVIAAGAETAVSPAALRAQLRDRLPPVMIPAQVLIADAFPTTANGKIDRAELASRAERAVFPPASTGDGGPFEQRIAAIVGEVLGRADIPPDADLAAAGLCSMDMVRIANRLEEAFGYRPGIEELFRFSTIRTFAGFFADGPRTPADGAGRTGQVNPSRAVAVPGAGELLTDTAQRREFAARQRAIRDDLPIASAVDLPDPGVPATDLFTRRTVRSFSAAPVSRRALGLLLQALRIRPGPDGTQRRAYASGSGTYSVQAYVHLKPGRTEQLPGGAYYYNPRDHKLVRLAQTGQLDRSAHWRWNRDPWEQAAFSLLLVADLTAITPLYGERSEHFATVEAGLMTQLLELTAPQAGLGLCQIGALDTERATAEFGLGPSHVVIHSLIGGLLPATGEEALS